MRRVTVSIDDLLRRIQIRGIIPEQLVIINRFYRQFMLLRQRFCAGRDIRIVPLQLGVTVHCYDAYNFLSSTLFER